MKIEQIAVRSEFLQRYVDFYYLLSTAKCVENTAYLAFPSPRTPLGFLNNASISRTPDKVRVDFSPNGPLEASIVGNFLKPLEVNFEPGIDEFAITFKPLGVNFFSPQNLGDILGEKVEQTSIFDKLLPSAQKMIRGVDAIDELESVLLSQFASNKQLEILESAIEIFEVSTNQVSEQQISKKLDISGKQLFRLFKNHLGVNPTQYRQLLRFRNTLDLITKTLQPQTLTEIGLSAGYYDQPHFIREFKSITDLAPREFLRKISLEANDKIVWQFLSENV